MTGTSCKTIRADQLDTLDTIHTTDDCDHVVDTFDDLPEGRVRVWIDVYQDILFVDRYDKVYQCGDPVEVRT